jgi:hypothetical protein
MESRSPRPGERGRSVLNALFGTWQSEMSVSDPLSLVATVTWLVAAIALALLYRKRAKWPKVVLAIVFCVIGSASASSSFLRWRMGLERESARHLTGVAELRFDDHLEFLQSRLARELDQDNAEERKSAAAMDWPGTFEAKHRVIHLELDNVMQNAFIQRYYSVWAADATVHQQQLERLATSTVNLTEQRPRRVTFDTYVDHVQAVREFLARLETEISLGTEQNAEPELPIMGF